MASFKDAEGRTWVLELDTVTADEIKEAKGLDLIDPSAMADTFVKLATGSTRLLVEVCWMLIAPQAEKSKVEPEDFGRAMKPQAVRDAYTALKDAVCDFFLMAADGAAMRKTWDAAEREAAKLIETKSDEWIEERLQALKLAGLAGGSPASSATSAV